MDKNRAATEEVKRAAEDLAVVHAVLDTQVSSDAQADEVDRAVAETKQIERRLDEATDTLHEVNATLEQTIKSNSSP